MDEDVGVWRRLVTIGGPPSRVAQAPGVAIQPRDVFAAAVVIMSDHEETLGLWIPEHGWGGGIQCHGGQVPSRLLAELI